MNDELFFVKKLSASSAQSFGSTFWCFILVANRSNFN